MFIGNGLVQLSREGETHEREAGGGKIVPDTTMHHDIVCIESDVAGANSFSKMSAVVGYDSAKRHTSCFLIVSQPYKIHHVPTKLRVYKFPDINLKVAWHSVPLSYPYSSLFCSPYHTTLHWQHGNCFGYNNDDSTKGDCSWRWPCWSTCSSVYSETRFTS